MVIKEELNKNIMIIKLLSFHMDISINNFNRRLTRQEETIAMHLHCVTSPIYCYHFFTVRFFTKTLKLHDRDPVVKYSTSGPFAIKLGPLP